MTHRAEKIVIITEKVIAEDVADLIMESGATGYTICNAGGRGSRGIRSGGRAVMDLFSNVKIEVIISSKEKAEEIADKVADTYFENYSGIVYLEGVEILRPQKF